MSYSMNDNMVFQNEVELTSVLSFFSLISTFENLYICALSFFVLHYCRSTGKQYAGIFYGLLEYSIAYGEPLLGQAVSRVF